MALLNFFYDTIKIIIVKKIYSILFFILYCLFSSIIISEKMDFSYFFELKLSSKTEKETNTLDTSYYHNNL